MAKEVANDSEIGNPQNLVLVTVGEDGQLQVTIQGFSPVTLWGIARLIEVAGNEAHNAAMMQRMAGKPRLVVPRQ